MPKCPHCGAPYHRQPGDVHEQGPIVYTCNCQRGWNMAGHTNNAATNESWEIKQMRTDGTILRNKLNPPDTTYVSSDIPPYRTCAIMGVGESVEPCAVQKELDECKAHLDWAREDGKRLQVENEHLRNQHDQMAAQIVEADMKGMKYKEECERLKAELAVQNRAVDIWEAFFR